MLHALVILVVTFITIGIHNSYGHQFYNGQLLIGIQLSKTCITLEKNNITGSCISYKLLQEFDNTNPKFTGKWVYDPFPYYHRLPSSIIDGWQYTNAKIIVMVDPEQNFLLWSKMIIINPQGFNYVSVNDTVSNHTRIEYHDRYVKDCQTAYVIPDINLIADTINYLESGCTKTNFNNTKIYQTPDSPFDMNTITVKSFNWITHFDNHTFQADCLFHKCNILINPYHNHGFGWN